jgi:hypothetical protein
MESSRAAAATNEPSGGGEGGQTPLTAREVLDALGARVSPDTVVVEEAPSSRADLLTALPARRPGGFLSAAMGGLGFAIPAATGLRLADRARPVVAVVGDGSALYAIQALWSAARYEAGVLVVVLSNGRYAIMDELARALGSRPVTGVRGRRRRGHRPLAGLPGAPHRHARAARCGARRGHSRPRRTARAAAARRPCRPPPDRVAAVLTHCRPSTVIKHDACRFRWRAVGSPAPPPSAVQALANDA